MTRDRLVSVRGGLVAVVAAALVAGLVLALTSGKGHPGAVQPAPATTSTSTSFAAQGLSRQTPDTVTPTGSPAQEQVDQNLAQGQLSDLSQLEAVKVPQPAISGGWPRLPIATAPETWAQTFVAALLDIRYSRRSRSALGSWLQAQEAPYLLIPGRPGQRLRDKELYATVLLTRTWFSRPGRRSFRHPSGKLTRRPGSTRPSAACWCSPIRAGSSWSLRVGSRPTTGWTSSTCPACSPSRADLTTTSSISRCRCRSAALAGIPGTARSPSTNGG